MFSATSDFAGMQLWLGNFSLFCSCERTLLSVSFSRPAEITTHTCNAQSCC
uniref:Uncharacterized protein n=1 Tax=Anguilla anguilla TaxID=7936 RepID=A0A0E9X314_ANGAN